MKISEVCALLKHELYNSGYKYGFFANGKRYTPNTANGYDYEFFDLSKTIYRIQNPSDTMREKIGTCIDAVMVMKTILDSINVLCKIWLLYHRTNQSVHTILTFNAEKHIVYLELTPQSNKPWYGKEILYSDEQNLINQLHADNYDIVDITDKIHIGESPDSLLQHLKK